MERYDAILEQLKKAQGRGLETITTRLDFVVQSLDELIREAKTTVQEALPESADECLPIDGVEAALNTFRDEADAERRKTAELEGRIDELEQAAAALPTETPMRLLRSLDGARSQSELLKELLPAISEHVARAVVLVLRDGKVTAWSGIGFADGEILRAWKGNGDESSALMTLVEDSRPVRFSPAEDGLFQEWLAEEEAPGEILLIPVVLRGKLMGAVYVDQLEGNPWNPETAQTLVAQVCWLIDTLQYRPTTAPSLAEPVEIGLTTHVTEPEEPPMDEDSVVEEEIVSPVADDDRAVAVESETVEDEESTIEDEMVEDEEPTIEDEMMEDEAEPAEDHEIGTTEEDPSATMKIDVSQVGFADTLPEQDLAVEEETEIEADLVGESFEPDEPTEPEFEAAAESTFEPEPEPDTQTSDDEEGEFHEAEAASPEPAEVPSEVQMPVTPPEDEEEEPSKPRFLDEPPPVQPVQPPPDEPEQEVSEDEAQREEARRFARLLVSEIKLYNEEQVERGRESNDIYHRLKEDIDRSREMFEKRISADVRAEQDFFNDELVRILADGDPEALGM